MIDFEDSDRFDFDLYSDEELEEDLEQTRISDDEWIEDEKRIFKIFNENQKNDKTQEVHTAIISKNNEYTSEENQLFELLTTEAKKHFSEIRLIQMEMAIKMIPFFAQAIKSENNRQKEAGLKGLTQINALYPELIELFVKLSN